MPDKSVVFFSNGNAVVLIDGKQTPELQESWIGLFAQFLESKGYNPHEFTFESPGYRVQLFKTVNEQWRIL